MASGRQFSHEDVKTVSIDQHADLREQSQKGSRAGFLLEFHETEVLPEQENSIRKRVFAEIDNPGGSLHPDLAVQCWIELRAAYKLVEKLRKMKKGGEYANVRLADSLVETEDNQ